ncbi:MAG: long-chain fatty acid--CoA ligase [Bdellovibrionota bacterium]
MPAPLQVDRFPNIPAAFFACADEHRESEAYSQLNRFSAGSARTRSSRTYGELRTRVQQIATFLSSLGVERGTSVAILSSTRPEWIEADLGILSTGGVATSIYQSLPAGDVAYILFDSGAHIVFAENQEQVDKLLEINEREWPIAGTEDRPAQTAAIQLKAIIAFEEVDDHPLVRSFAKLLEEPIAESFILPDIKPDDLAALVYTSGTTGPPKGVMQTHRNHLSNVRQVFDSGMVNDLSTIMLFLPLAHSFAKLMVYIGTLTRVGLVFPSVNDPKSSKVDPQSVMRDIRDAGAKIVPVVPRFLEKMQDGIRAQGRKRGMRARFIRLTLWSAQKVYRARKDGRHPGLLATSAFEGTGTVRRKIRAELFGSAFQFAVSGGAKLPVAVAEFFDSLGIEIVEGYGLTETCVATNVNVIGRRKIGTVGPVLSPDIELRIAEDGEILYRGPNVTPGYLHRPTATAQLWDSDGWFHTGDLGSVDEDGFLSITGRKKDIIVTSGGKKVAPQAIEERLKMISCISQAVLIGDGRPFCVALLTLNHEAAQHFAKEHKLDPAVPLHEQRKLFATVWDDVEHINATLSSFETIKNILLLGEDFSIENGFLTPTFKVKRSAVEARYKKELDALYRATKKTTE